MSMQVVGWLSVILECSSWRKDSLHYAEMIKQESFNEIQLSDDNLYLMSQYFQVIQECMCMHQAIYCWWGSIQFRAPGSSLNSIHTWASQVLLKLMWSNHGSKVTSLLCSLVGTLNNVSASFISLPGLYCTIALYYCNLRSILWRWEVWLSSFWGLSLLVLMIRFNCKGRSIQICVKTFTCIDAKNMCSVDIPCFSVCYWFLCEGYGFDILYKAGSQVHVRWHWLGQSYKDLAENVVVVCNVPCWGVF